ncbi:O-antigen ligase family protein [Parasporobacterium paucivorans]|uniref:O-antigen ligase n=1 Tax=Parasporobacterium paucivorans DSM 15970 TaxID=1122934 RepID=A0A1M6EAX2_9FIRM|nr:O-antigen ligase family protein [Parasporobacterium paucivorans]SHI82591.1 O-antigen ligase [Parasporobacterium paucivorans DSM 15970]
MKMQNEKFEFQSVIKFWLLVFASVTPLLYVPIGGTLNSYFPKLVFLITISVFLVASIILFRKQAHPLFEFDTENKFLLALYILLIISTFFALDRTTAIFGSTVRFEGLVALTIYFFVFSCSRKIETLGKNFILIMILTGTIISIHGILQVYGFDPVPVHFYAEILVKMHSSFSSMGQPNHLGTYLVLLIPFAVYVYIEKKHVLGFWFYNIMFFALLCTNTRGAWIGFFVSLCIYFIFKVKNHKTTGEEKRKTLYVISASVLLLILFSLTNENSFGARFISIFLDFSKVAKDADDADGAGSGRIYIWKKAIELIKARPLFGVGPDNVSVALRTFYEKDVLKNCGEIGFYNWSKVHNEYLQTAVTTGIPSLLVYIGFVGIILKKATSRIRHSDIYLPLTASLTGFYVIGFFNNEVIMFAYILWMFLGLACSKKVISFKNG